MCPNWSVNIKSLIIRKFSVFLELSMDQDLLVYFLLFVFFITMFVTYYNLPLFFIYPQVVQPTTSYGYGGANEAALRKARQLEMARLSASEHESDLGLSAASKKRVAHAGASSGEVS